MHRPDIHRFDRPVVTIHPGELYATDADEIIQTLLGSCVAVCLVDNRHAIAGMNHFMLPGRVLQFDMQNDESTKYGHLAIERWSSE
jgi:chemotaxis protein CheD